MEWRERVAVWFGPSLLGGVTLGDWFGLLRENPFAVTPSKLVRAGLITAFSLGNVPLRWWEIRSCAAKLKDVIIPPPLFILGHWRSGTSHLHNLLSVDHRFGSPNLYQVTFPHTFPNTEGGLGYRAIDFFLTKRRPMDNMQLSLGTPFEDEYATCISTFHSPYMSLVFPRRREHYDKYLTFEDVPPEHVVEWKEALLLFMKKVTSITNRPLILKSPPHTCRVRLLLEMFPDAKFVHVHRRPDDILQSTRHQVNTALRWYQLQSFSDDELDDWIIRRFRTMYDSFFEERALVPDGQFHEVCYEDLESNPIDEIRALYSSLDLPEFSNVEQPLRDYVASLSGYKKNAFPDLSADAQRRITDEWQSYFDAWGYES